MRQPVVNLFRFREALDNKGILMLTIEKNLRISGEQRHLKYLKSCLTGFFHFKKIENKIS